MDKSGNTITLLEILRDSLANLLHNAGIVAADKRAIVPNGIEGSPVCRIESDSYSLDQHIVIARLGDGYGQDSRLARCLAD